MKILLLIVIISTSFAFAEELRPFKTDYCTNFPEGTKEEPELWKHCCLDHDLFMWAGGNKIERNKADLGLKECVLATGKKFQAELMYRAIRAGSLSPFKYPNMKWNNRWKNRPDYQSLTEADIEQIQTEIYNNYDFISLETKDRFMHELFSRLE